MADAPRGFPIDWLADPAAPASDLELALLLVNSRDLLEEVPDRLADLTWLTRAFSSVGHADLVTALSDDDLPGLRDLRGALRRVFESDDAGEVAATLNPLLDEARALLVVDDSALALRVGVGLSGLAALNSRLPAALASYVVDHGTSRLGVRLKRRAIGLFGSSSPPPGVTLSLIHI